MDENVRSLFIYCNEVNYVALKLVKLVADKPKYHVNGKKVSGWHRSNGLVTKQEMPDSKAYE